MRSDTLARIREAIGPGPIKFTVPTEPEHTFDGYLLADPDATGAPIEHGGRAIDLDPRELADLWPACHFCDAPAAITWRPYTNDPALRFCLAHFDTYGTAERLDRAGKITRHRPRAA